MSPNKIAVKDITNTQYLKEETKLVRKPGNVEGPSRAKVWGGT